MNIVTHEVHTKFFQGHGMTTQRYLHEYSRLGVELVKKLGATKNSHRVEICTGFANIQLKDDLRKLGFETDVVEVMGVLQDCLESIHKEYIKRIVGKDLYYDPKEMEKSDIPSAYYECVEYGKQNCPELLKTGWKSLSGG